MQSKMFSSECLRLDTLAENLRKSANVGRREGKESGLGRMGAGTQVTIVSWRATAEISIQIHQASKGHAETLYLPDHFFLFLPPINQSLPSLVSELLSVELVGVGSDSIVLGVPRVGWPQENLLLNQCTA